MNGLEERLINDLTGLADTAEFRPEGAAAIANSVRRRRQHRRLRQVVLVAAVSAVLGGITARQLTDRENISTGDEPSRTTVTISPTTTTPPQTTAAPSADPELFLTGDGLGSVKFGDDFDTVMAAVEAELGPPSLSNVEPLTDCEAPVCEPEWYEECSTQGPYAVTRTASWVGLTLSFRGAGAESLVLRAWTADSESPLETPEGLRVGDQRQNWLNTYRERISFETFQPPDWESVTLELQGTITGYALSGAMNSLAGGYICTQGDI